MSKLKRQVAVLALCLVAVLAARFYVSRLIEDPSVADSTAIEPSGEGLEQTSGAAALTVEMPRETPEAALGPVAGAP